MRNTRGTPVVTNCIVVGDYATTTGIRCASGTTSRIENCTLLGLAVGVRDFGSSRIEWCTAVGCKFGFAGTSSTDFQYCIAANCDPSGFDGGNSAYCIAPDGFDSPASLIGTSTADPLFCGSGDYTLRVDSYGNPENNAIGKLIGAYPVRCMYGSLARDSQFSGGSLNLIGETTIPSGKALVLGPGTIVEADTANYGGSGDVELIVRGVLRAEGTAQDTVKFTGLGGTESWQGIRLDASGGGDKVILDYVHLQNAYIGLTDTGNPPADSLVLRNCRLDLVGAAGIEAIGNGTGPGVVHIEDSVIDMEGADTGIYISGSNKPDYSTLIRNVTVAGDATGLYGIALGTEGASGSPAVVDSVTVSGLTTGIGILVFDASPELGVSTISGCKTGIEIAAGGARVGPSSGLLSLASCTTGLLVSGDALDVTVQNLSITSPSGGIGVYTDDSVTGSFTGLFITEGGTGFKAYSDSVHTLRSSEITEFTTIGVSIAYDGMIHLGDGYSDQGGNSIYASGTSPPKYINSKNRLGGLGPVKAEYNWWGADPPVSSLMGGSTVDYSPWLSANPMASVFGMQFERVIGPQTIRVVPNPSRGTVRLLLSGYQGSVDVSVFDLLGRQINFWKFTGTGQEDVLTWDGTDTRGHQTPRGVYFFRVRAGESTQTVKIIRGQ